MSSAERPVNGINGVHLADTFVNVSNAVTTGNLGQLGWAFTTIGNATTYSYVTAADTIGILRSTTNTTADGDGSVVRSADAALTLGAAGGGFAAVVRYPNITGNQLAGNDIYVGTGDVVTAAVNTIGIGFQFDAGVVTLRTDSAANGDEAKAAADWDQGTYTGTNAGLTSGTTAVIGEWMAIEARWYGENANGGPDKVDFFLGSDTTVKGAQAAKIYIATLDCHISSTEVQEIHALKHYQNSGSGATFEADIDTFEFWMWSEI